jgi:hypothetical protein
MDMIPRPLSGFATIPSARLLFDLQLKACRDRCDALSEVSNALSSFAATVEIRARSSACANVFIASVAMIYGKRWLG